MGKNLFEWVADRISGQGRPDGNNNDDKDNNGAGADRAAGGGNAIDREGELLEAVIAVLRTHYLGRNVSRQEKALVVWIRDSLLYDSVSRGGFADTLATAVADELGCAFGAVRLESGGSPGEDGLTQVTPSVYLQVCPLREEASIRRAVIYPVSGCGSMMQDFYLLDSEQIRQLPGRRYNIGAGSRPAMPNHTLRENHIAVDDRPDSPRFEQNRYVSRAHAYISFEEESGFVLHAEWGGTRAAQKRTHVQRGNEIIELNNVLVPVPLRNGDHIVLSKYVHLLFKEA